MKRVESESGTRTMLPLSIKYANGKHVTPEKAYDYVKKQKDDAWFARATFCYNPFDKPSLWSVVSVKHGNNPDIQGKKAMSGIAVEIFVSKEKAQEHLEMLAAMEAL